MLRSKLLPAFQDLVVNSDLTEVVDETEFLPSNSETMLGEFFCNLKNLEQQSSPSCQAVSLLDKYLLALNEANQDLYSCDEFRMFEFKVRRCMRGRSHDWTECPFVHAGEKARRRDPRKFHYSGSACADFRKGICEKGDTCEFAHGVFECWLHPSRYRTHLCKDGRNCRRRVCFFAHTLEQLRLTDGSSARQTLSDGRLCRGLLDRSCSQHGGSSTFNAAARSSLNCANHSSFCVSSPTSTLVGLRSHSPPSLSPPPSPKSLPPSPEEWHSFLLAQSTDSVAGAPVSTPIASVQLQQTDFLMPAGVSPLNLAQMRLQQAFAAGSHSPSPYPILQMTDLSIALQQMEILGENSIWLQNQGANQPAHMEIQGENSIWLQNQSANQPAHMSIYSSGLSPFRQSSLNTKFTTPFGDDKGAARWGTEVIEVEHSDLPGVESGRALYTKIYGELKGNSLEIADNVDLGWVNDLVE